jgi:hypothetical protein
MTTPWFDWLASVLPHTRPLERDDLPRKAPNDAASLIARQIKRESSQPEVPPEDAA